MSEHDDRLLSFMVGGRSIGANLQRAIASGKVVQREDGRFELARTADRSGEVVRLSGTITRHGDFAQPCVFLNHFMFGQVYAEAAVPYGCRNCFKVKVVSDNLRQLMAVKEISESVPFTSKSGVEVDNPENQHLYGTYFYTLGLDRAREVYKVLRSKIDGHKKLGPGMKMLIKRGCTNYERKCGPSDQYTFDPRLEEIEHYLLPRFVEDVRSAVKRKIRDGIQLLEWVRIAYRIGDDTYKDFTDGKDLHPSVVTYPPEEPARGEVASEIRTDR
jgi:hypothetical protein